MIWKIIKKILLAFFIIAIVIVGYVTYNGYEMYVDAKENLSIEDMIANVKKKENYTSLDEMPTLYKKAVIAVEDRRFYKHKGIDYLAIGRAFINDIKAMAFVEGGSTITQQLAKNTYFTQEKKITRKIAEVFMALDIEEHCDKNEILELYLNTAYFGEGCQTVSEASRVYFKKEPYEMNDYESTMLAGIPNAPSVYAPTQNLELAIKRQRQVLDKLVEVGEITYDEAIEIFSQNVGYTY